LVSFGKLYGILTARHVVDELQKEKKKGLTEVGLAQVTTRAAQLQGMRLPVDWINEVKIGEADSECGPDLAFLRLPDQIAAALKANCSFLNLRQEAELSRSPAPENTKQRDFILGVVAELGTVECDPSKALDMGLICILMNEGNVIEIAACDGCDRLEFTPVPCQRFVAPSADQEVSPPVSYGGTSGGGLWRLYAEPTADSKERLIQSRLLGVAYYQTKAANGSRTIICHGPQSIFSALPERIHGRWKGELRDD
jgi:hypothetical protein